MGKTLYEKNFNILVLGQVISLFGSSIQRFALSLYLLDLTGSAGIFSAILALSMVPVVLISPIAGMLADRGNKKRLMIGLDSLSALLLLVYVWIVFNGQDHVLVIATVMVLLSTISTIYQPVVNTCVPLIVSRDHLVRANAIIQQVASLSQFLGPILAGLLYGFFGITGVVIINLVSFLFSALLELFLEIPHQRREGQQSFKAAFMTDMKESYHYLRHENLIVCRMLLFSGFYNLFLVPVFSVATPYLIKVTFALSSEVYGWAEGMIALGMIVGGFIITYRPNHFHIKRVYQLLYLTSVSMMLMGGVVYLFHFGFIDAATSVVLFTVCGMIIMGVLGIANVLSAAYLYQAVDGAILGKILAFGSAFATLCIPLGQILFGGLLEVLSQKLYLLILMAAFFVFLVTLLVRWNVRLIKEDEKSQSI
ncbi:MAG: MFS transporter [Turicibacter sp.]|uniref:MFS transporter n=2 Tax=Turicibacter TaxID=191303 RepID=A0ABM8INM8_9FIRM|nr:MULTISPECIES: MFS transporter [unclassified Turicibacter]MCI8701171.1 MFS transporter [Turicibacter sp.]BEH91546.1 MFS transporter [Turicibacter sp. TC023]MCI9351108.1 MFS transporter [Turicibacter sp.]MCU7203730.1 MFS transporter [Turicibacter sp. TA25]NCE78658.1 MFS transporter [Turicibacter sp. TS3]